VKSRRLGWDALGIAVFVVMVFPVAFSTTVIVASSVPVARVFVSLPE